MTPERLRECLTTMGWGSAELGYVLGADPRAVRRWMAGKMEIPSGLDPWLEELVKLVEHPPDWRASLRPRAAGCHVRWPTWVRLGTAPQ